MTNGALYNDGRISCDQAGIRIGWYYPWGAKRIPYASVKAVENLQLTGANKVRRWRIWGSGDFVHWWNLDPGRTHKDVALVLDVATASDRRSPQTTPKRLSESSVSMSRSREQARFAMAKRRRTTAPLWGLHHAGHALSSFVGVPLEGNEWAAPILER